MAYQNVEAKFSVWFADASDAKTLVKAFQEQNKSLRGFELNMTSDEIEFLEAQEDYKMEQKPTLEILFSNQFDVETIKGYEGSREEPPCPTYLEGYMEEGDVENLLLSAIKSVGIDIGYVDIECLEYEGDREEDILRAEEDERYSY